MILAIFFTAVALWYLHMGVVYAVKNTRMRFSRVFYRSAITYLLISILASLASVASHYLP